MVLLTLQDVCKAFGLNVILKDINLTLKEGQRLGLVGVNGSGKSTLMKIITGDMAPDSGTVSLLRGTRVGLLTQQADITSELTVVEELSRVFEPLRRMEEKLRDLERQMAENHENAALLESLSSEYTRLTDRFEQAGGYEWPSRIQGVLAGLGFSKERREQPARLLSGGEKTRLCLARILLMQPELLMLDEPTNHLDLEATQWLEDTLRKYKGTVIVISHDRYFLNAVCDGMAELSMTHLTQYNGNYDAFMIQRRMNLERQLKEYAMQQKEIARQQAIIDRYRMYNREKSIKAAESREKRLEKIERIERPIDEAKVRFSFEAKRRTGDDVLMVQDLSKSFDGRTLFQHFSLHLRAGDRVAVIGPNGVGKTTLLRIIMHEIPADTGEVIYGANVDIGYYDQHQAGLTMTKTVMDELWDAFPRMEPDEVRSVLALFLFTGDDVFQKIETLSGGERGRVALAKLLLSEANLLLLDEPTNHLDVFALEALQEMLSGYRGTLLFVSHDAAFSEAVATRFARFEGEKLVSFEETQARQAEREQRDRAAEQTRLEISVLQMRMADLAARMSAPRRGDSPEKLNAEYQALAEQVRALKNPAR